MKRFAFAVMIGVALSSTMLAQNGGAPAGRGPTRQANIILSDGSNVKMELQLETLEVLTKYGKMQIPIDDIRRIEMGLHIPAGVETQIETSIRNLASEAFKQREDASKDLLQVGHWAVPALTKASNSPELEVAKRAQSLLVRIAERTPPDILKIRQDDVVHTRDFPVVGRITTPTLKGRSTILGELTLNLSHVRSLQAIGQRGEAEMTLDAAKFGSALDQWFDTGILLDPQLRMTVMSEGNCDLWPQTPGQYVAHPRGYNTPGKGGAFLAGALVGKVGETGRTFLVGERYEGNATEEGKLFLQIVPSPWNNSSAGTYRVRITTEHIAAAGR